jgi:hypothetical protein
MILTDSALTNKPCILLYGQAGVGKTRFWLTAPGKIRVLGWDRRPEEWWKPYLHKGIDYEHYSAFKQEFPLRGETDEIMVSKIKSKNSELLEKFFQDLEISLKSPSFSTIVVENGTEVNSTNKLAEFGKVTKIMPTDYPALRNTLRRITNLVAQHGQNKVFILTCEENEIYVGNKASGKMKQDADKTFRHASNVILRMTNDVNGKCEFKATIEKCVFNYGLTGSELTNDEIDYSVLHELIFGE